MLTKLVLEYNYFTMKNETNLVILTQYIIEKYHNPLKQDLPKIHLLLDKIVQVHGVKHPEFAEIRNVFIKFKEEMLQHLNKEEKILFPMMLQLQKTLDENKKLWSFHCGSIKNPITQMEHEHGNFERYLEEIKNLSSNFLIPNDACNTYKLTYNLLKSLYEETLEHANLENTALHKIAIEIEKKCI